MEGVVTLKVRPTFEAVQIQLRHLRRAVLGHAQRPVAATLRVLPCSAREPVLGLSAGLLGLSRSCAQRSTAVGLPAACSAGSHAAGGRQRAGGCETGGSGSTKEEMEEECFEGRRAPPTRPPGHPPARPPTHLSRSTKEEPQRSRCPQHWCSCGRAAAPGPCLQRGEGAAAHEAHIVSGCQLPVSGPEADTSEKATLRSG